MDVARCGDALWRAVTYLSVAQLHLRANPLVTRRLRASDLKRQPSGHWGTVPGNAWILVHLGLAAARRPNVEIIPVIGAGHAGVVQRSLAWLTEDLASVEPHFGRDAAGLAALIASFPDMDHLGSEVHPALSAGAYMGGWLGGALAFAQGMALEMPGRVVVPIVGDGECETPMTAASWLAQRALSGSGVLPVVHLNGQRMGGCSLLGAMNDEQVKAYARGLDWEPIIARVVNGRQAEHTTFHEIILAGFDAARCGRRCVIFLRCVKGWSGPVGAHKTPLTNPGEDPDQLRMLGAWLRSYRPLELFDDNAQPKGALALAIDQFRICYPQPTNSSKSPVACPQWRGFSVEIGAVLQAHAAAGDFKLFSPDELQSNRLGDLASEAWAHEVLAEEVLLGWLAGWTASGRRGLLISYEAFATLLLTGLVGHLKQRRLIDATLPSINLLLTSYGWQNVYTHGDPSLVTALLGLRDPAVHIYTPADVNRAAWALDDALRSTGRVNVIVVGKHPAPLHPSMTVGHERRHGFAIWSHLSDPGEPDLTLVCAGDLAAAVVSTAVGGIRERHRCRLRVINVHDLIVLAGPSFRHHVGEHASLVVATLGHPAAIWGLLGGQFGSAEVVGWREPPHPMAQDAFAAYTGLDVAGVTQAAAVLLSD